MSVREVGRVTYSTLNFSMKELYTKDCILASDGARDGTSSEPCCTVSPLGRWIGHGMRRRARRKGFRLRVHITSLYESIWQGPQASGAA